MTDKISTVHMKTDGPIRLSLDPEDDPTMIMARNRRQRIDRARAVIEARIKGEAAPDSLINEEKQQPGARAIAHALRHALRRTSG